MVVFAAAGVQAPHGMPDRPDGLARYFLLRDAIKAVDDARSVQP